MQKNIKKNKKSVKKKKKKIDVGLPKKKPWPIASLWQPHSWPPSLYIPTTMTKHMYSWFNGNTKLEKSLDLVPKMDTRQTNCKIRRKKYVIVVVVKLWGLTCFL
jgi:hypothetical protein